MKILSIALLALAATGCTTDKPPNDASVASGPNTSDSDATTSYQVAAPASTDLASENDAVGQKDAPVRSDSRAQSPTDSSPPKTDAGLAPPRTTTEATGNSMAAPDNTRVNQRDRDEAALTPGDQGNSQSDTKITQLVRQAVMADKSLSFTAKNVKIITVAGKVTLRGPVNSAAERTSIEQAAKNVAGVTNVDNQLEIKP